MSLRLPRARPRLPHRGGGEDGSAMIEFVLLTVVVLVPLVLVMATLSLVQRASYAASGAARDAARVYATAPDVARGQQRAQAAASLIFADYEVAQGSHVDLACDGTCLAPGTRVRATAVVRVPLPGISGIVGQDGPTTITITSTQASPVDEFRSAP